MILECKISKARDLIEEVMQKRTKKLTIKKLQQICGLLNFLSRAIVPGRTFTRRLYTFAPPRVP